MDFKLAFEELEGMLFMNRGYICKRCGGEISVKNCGGGIYAIRCRNEKGFRIVRAESIYEVEETFGVKERSCLTVQDLL